MVSFQQRLVKALEKRSIPVTYDPHDRAVTSILVVGGTRQVADLWRAQRKGVRIVQRLDGMNWLHRVRQWKGRNLRHFIRAEYSNWLLVWIRNHLADRVVYQSEFARQWWHQVYGQTGAVDRVIHNGVDLDQFSPQGDGSPPEDVWRLLMVEGSLMGGYETGLETAIELAMKLSTRINQDNTVQQKPVELYIAGRVSAETKSEWESRVVQNKPGFTLKWAGLVPGEGIPELDRSAHLLFSADLNAACPNSVIEAMACGLPVLAFDTGALTELVGSEAGKIVSYGGDPWKLDPPDIDSLAEAGLELLKNNDHHRRAARERALGRFDIEKVADAYLKVLNDG